MSLFFNGFLPLFLGQLWVGIVRNRQKVKYDRAQDILYISFSGEAIHESDEEKKGIILDYTADGQMPVLKC
jgi:hypothetical protein